MSRKLLRSATVLLPLPLLLLLLAFAAGADASAQAADQAKPGQCSNKIQDGTESDVDCGGQECSRRCALRQKCNTGGDCVTGTCDLASATCVCPAGLAIDPVKLTCYSQQHMCYNARKDGNEADVDCGGSCDRRCVLGQTCNSGTDCYSDTCAAVPGSQTLARCVCPAGQMPSSDKRRCIADPSVALLAAKPAAAPAAAAAAACGANGVKCGVGQPCKMNAECNSGICNVAAKKCSCPPGFTVAANGVACAPAAQVRPLGGMQLTQQQLQRAASERSQLADPAEPCANGVKDFSESDVDCGGPSCWKCNLGQSCRQASDCSSLTCNAATKKCVCPLGMVVSGGGNLCMDAPKQLSNTDGPCFNGKRDPQESDVDCGGPCKGCSFGHACKVNKDCAAGVCNPDQRVCMCPRGQYISPDSSACLSEEELCYNGAKDAGESDTDCGGSCKAKCNFGQFCNGPADCATGVCDPASQMCGCPASAPLSPDGSKCLTACDSGPNPCKNNGKCIPNPGAAPNFKCSCPANYNGTTCEVLINTCDITNPCRNGGKCIPTPGYVPGKGGPDFRCYCMAGYSGAMCEVVKSSCFAASQICKNGGSCVPLPGQMPDFTCNCKPGFRGLTCTEKISPNAAAGANVCQTKKPCMNGGMCQPKPGTASGFSCSCPEGFEGATCDVDTYVEDSYGDANNNDTAANGSNATAPVPPSEQPVPPAAPPANGTAQDVNTCDSGTNPCENGECVANPGATPDFTCNCDTGFKGRLCDAKIPTCETANPCRNGGQCVTVDAESEYDYPPEAADFECKCPPGFAGKLCDMVPVTTVTADPGRNTGPVTVTTGSTTTCDGGNPCRNGGKCTPRPGLTPDYICACASGFSGTLCQNKGSTCSLTNPCANGGTCNSVPGASPDFKCSCSNGFVGALCDTDCYGKALVPDASGTKCVEAGDVVGGGGPSNVTSSTSGVPSGRPSGGAGPVLTAAAAASGAPPVTPAAAAAAAPGGSTTSAAAAVAPGTCGRGASRLCVSGEPCKASADCENNDCRMFAALDNVPRCSCPKGSFIFLPPGALPKCVTQAEMCSNGVRDQYEGDVDCGFYCGQLCGLGQACKGSFGCASGHCDMAAQKCSCAPGFVATPDGSTCIPK